MSQMISSTGLQNTSLKILTGNANPALALTIAKRLGLTLSEALIDRFSDGETRVAIPESVRNKNVLIIQPTSTPCNDHLMELFLMVDTARRASAKKIIALIPYFAY